MGGFAQVHVCEEGYAPGTKSDSARTFWSPVADSQLYDPALPPRQLHGERHGAAAAAEEAEAAAHLAAGVAGIALKIKAIVDPPIVFAPLVLAACVAA